MDTQIGTRPQIGALEIHQAYILASLNWLQQTRSLEMNHVAIEKAKLLGFDHSSVITDAEKYMNNLETFKCYNFFSQNFPGCIILKEEDFINLNVKYGLVSGPLSYYKGDIPEDNLDEILATKATLDSLTDNKYSNCGKLFTADKLKRSINAAITGRFNANVVTRKYGLRQQVLYLMYYGIE